jgi:hypothetical protein
MVDTKSKYYGSFQKRMITNLPRGLSALARLEKPMSSREAYRGPGVLGEADGMEER